MTIRLHSERGFTFIELLVTVAILGVLSALALTAFAVYKDNAEVARGQSTMRNARVSFEVGDEDATPGLSVPLTFTATAGGPVPGALSAILPGAETPKDLMLGAQYEYCDTNSPAMQLNQLLVVVPCRATRRLQWMRFCGGLEVIQENLPGGGC